MSMLDLFTWLVLIVLLFSSIAVMVLAAMPPGMIARHGRAAAQYSGGLRSSTAFPLLSRSGLQPG
ncbi:hypothetical protein FQV39_30105 (plasmid) [Bosea sp. F3-2]|uniref:hypothetical protein n=1 Tax=Bosea sp. F3-2 TaxID=2599640 RepID=UPI0011EE0909|nr:hypothetical protein [Bosea sp. F3-2]QEL26915.1 hypothetical protein FQV39_30105 [Bosea sp. F3-2]